MRPKAPRPVARVCRWISRVPGLAAVGCRFVGAGLIGGVGAGCGTSTPAAQLRSVTSQVIVVAGQTYEAVTITIDSFPSNAIIDVNGRPAGRAPVTFAVATTPDNRFVEPLRIRALVGEDDIDRSLRAPNERGARRDVVTVFAGFAPGDPIPPRIVATQQGMDY